MRAWEYYYKEVEIINKISVSDKWYEQSVLYKNRLINNPIKMGTAIDTNAFSGDLPIPTGPCPFKGKSAEEKFRMCGVQRGWTPSQAYGAGVITNVTFNQTSGPKTLQMNKYIAEDFKAICNEILQLGFFKLNVGNCFRTSLSAGGKSLHQIGVAVDINPGRGGNPWFSCRIPKTQPEPAPGSTPWGMKSCPYHGGYDRSICIWHWGHPVVRIFLNHGWGWGGSYGDVMHFSITGN